MGRKERERGVKNDAEGLDCREGRFCRESRVWGDHWGLRFGYVKFEMPMR